MFCNQCQEASKGIGCTGHKGVCGISAETKDYQDVLINVLKGISIFSVKARELGIEKPEINTFITKSLFKTITNANFSSDDIKNDIYKGLEMRDNLRSEISDRGAEINPAELDESATWKPSGEDELVTYASRLEYINKHSNEDIHSLRQLVAFGLKGLAAYKDHAEVLGHSDPALDAFIQKALAAITNDKLSADENIALAMETGKFGVDVMALLDKANTETYGHPEITKVNLGVQANPGILISGHDLKDMEELLKQTEGSGVDVYTHSEMLPAHYYPAFKKYGHFVGNYGNAWWQQGKEFASFNGPILMTTNCLIAPKEPYRDRIFTTGNVAYDGMKHIEEIDGRKDFTEIIELAKTCPPPTEIETGEIIGGFAHNQVMALADKVVDAVKSGAIKKFFVMAGCDGRMKGRSYYEEFAEKLPKDTVILTAGCAKYRYNKLPLGDIGGIPRVLDAGQCNDSYSLAVIALKLKEVFELNDVNDLPIAYNIAWYEQKAVIVLLALLYLGVKNIHLGPTLPAFLSPNVAKVLVETFGIGGIGEVDEDINMFMN